MGLAIEQTLRLYPGLLENNQNLLFMLKCRQFIEMVNGSDFEVKIERQKISFSIVSQKKIHLTERYIPQQSSTNISNPIDKNIHKLHTTQ